MSILKYLFALVAFLVIMASVFWVVSSQTQVAVETSPPPSASTFQVYLIALEGTHAETATIGCGDALVAVTQPADSTPTLEMAINELLRTADNTVTEDNVELYNALAQSTLTVQKAEIKEGVATVNLAGQLSLGGVCDEPRVEAQLKATARQFPGVNEVRILLNDRPLGIGSI